MALYTPSLFNRLLDQRPHDSHEPAGFGWTLEQLKDAVARDLEDLFNSRAALSEDLLADYPEVSKSVLNYGLSDFAGMCLTSDVDRKKICDAVQLAIERHEPRLYAVSATLRTRTDLDNRVDIVIEATLKADADAEPVLFDAVLKPSTQQYLIRASRLSRDEAS